MKAGNVSPEPPAPRMDHKIKPSVRGFVNFNKMISAAKCPERPFDRIITNKIEAMKAVKRDIFDLADRMVKYPRTGGDAFSYRLVKLRKIDIPVRQLVDLHTAAYIIAHKRRIYTVIKRQRCTHGASGRCMSIRHHTDAASL